MSEERKRQEEQLKINTCWNCHYQKHTGYGQHECNSKNPSATYYKTIIWDLFNNKDCSAFKSMTWKEKYEFPNTKELGKK